jgi:hypothetical protein
MIRESGDNYEIDYSTSEQGMAVLIKTNSQHAFALIYESESLHEIWLLQIHSDMYCVVNILVLKSLHLIATFRSGREPCWTPALMVSASL